MADSYSQRRPEGAVEGYMHSHIHTWVLPGTTGSLDHSTTSTDAHLGGFYIIKLITPQLVLVVSVLRRKREGVKRDLDSYEAAAALTLSLD